MISPRAFRTSPTAFTTTSAATMTSPPPPPPACSAHEPRPVGTIFSSPAALPHVALPRAGGAAAQADGGAHPRLGGEHHRATGAVCFDRRVADGDAGNRCEI